MARQCDICNKIAVLSTDEFFNLAYSDNGDWYPEYSAKTFCKNDFQTWLEINLSTLIFASRILDPING